MIRRTDQTPAKKARHRMEQECGSCNASTNTRPLQVLALSQPLLCCLRRLLRSLVGITALFGVHVDLQLLLRVDFALIIDLTVGDSLREGDFEERIINRGEVIILPYASRAISNSNIGTALSRILEKYNLSL